MSKLFAFAAALAVCAGPAFAQSGPVAYDCVQDPETTGALPTDPRSLYLPGERPVKTEADRPEESWQAEARKSYEERRQDLLDCGVD